MKLLFCCPVCGRALHAVQPGPLAGPGGASARATGGTLPLKTGGVSASAGAKQLGAKAGVASQPPRVWALRCEAGHSFDVAREGYVNLLAAQQMHAKTPGDSKEMVEARRAFLAAGHYAPFAEALCTLLARELGGGTAALAVDAGCGEGYYTRAAAAALPGVRFAAFDISKAAVRAAAQAGRAQSNVQYAVAGSFCAPLPAQCADAVCNIFSPAAAAEFARILKKDGVLVYAVPGARHLFGLKQVLYDTPYENPVQDVEYPGFSLEERVPVRSSITVQGPAVQQLFAMTPYFWKTPAQGAQRLAACDVLTTDIAFDFLLYRRRGA